MIRDQYITSAFQRFGKDDSQDVLTPPSLCREMLSKVDVTNKNILVLYNLEFALILFKELDVPANHIYIYTNSTTKKQACELLGFNVLYSEEVLGIKDIDMKFDIVIGNPPYNSNVNSSKLWPKFVEMGFGSLKTEGYMGFVTPSKWVFEKNQKINRAIKVLHHNQLQYINLDTTTEYFPKISENICHFGVFNKPSLTPLKITEGNKTVETTFIDFFNSKQNPIVQKVYNKYPKKSPLKIGPLRHYDFGMGCSLKELTQSGDLTKEPTPTHTIPVSTSIKTTMFAKSENIDTESWRLVINMAGYYFSDKHPDKYMKVVKGEGTTSGLFSLLFSTEEEALNAFSLMRSKLYRYVVNQKSSGFNLPVVHLALLDCSKPWSDQEVYQHFDLTQEEVDLIESTVK